MGRRKAGAGPGAPLRQILAIKGLPGWREWLEAASNRAGMSSSEVIDEALAEWARKRGFDPPPSRTGA